MIIAALKPNNFKVVGPIWKFQYCIKLQFEQDFRKQNSSESCHLEVLKIQFKCLSNIALEFI